MGVAAAVILVLDRSCPLDTEDADLLRETGATDRLVVVNKADRPAQWHERDLPDSTRTVTVSLRDDPDTPELRRAIAQGGDVFAPHPEPRLVNELGLKPLYVTMAWYQNVSSYKFNRGDNGSVSRLTRRDRFLWPDGRKLGDGEKPSPAIVLSESVLRRYVGHYEHNPKSLSKIALEAKRLWLDSHELESISETEFLGKKEPLQVSFKLNESRDVTGMRVRSIGSRRQYRKVAPQMITDRY